MNISGSGILAVIVGSSWSWENPATEYDHRITASTLIPFSAVFLPDPARSLSPGESFQILFSINLIVLRSSTKCFQMNLKN